MVPTAQADNLLSKCMRWAYASTGKFVGNMRRTADGVFFLLLFIAFASCDFLTDWFISWNSLKLMLIRHTVASGAAIDRRISITCWRRQRQQVSGEARYKRALMDPERNIYRWIDGRDIFDSFEIHNVELNGNSFRESEILVFDSNALAAYGPRPLTLAYIGFIKDAIDTASANIFIECFRCFTLDKSN